jgi:hypothetical protein
MRYLILNAYRPEFLLVLRTWVETRRPPHASELLRLIDERLDELASSN